ncbi:ATP synthase F1 subunit delta [Mycoplasmatota bacterium]|nr:ATP synthase F1 subunit delta [Mycoplasmatota bacterium]
MGKEFTKEYATALFDLSLEKNSVESIKEELIIISAAFLENKDFEKLLSHPQLSKENKKDIVNNVFKELNSTLLHFLYVIIENDRVNDIKFINKEFSKLYNAYNEVIDVEAKTTIPLTEDQIGVLKNKLSVKYRHKIRIDNIIDPSIGGGMLLTINHEVMDYTIKNQLRNLKSHILKQT